jgi:hypothetical protein
MGESIYNSLIEILDYLERDEARHFGEAGEPEYHIYRDIMRVRAWADTNAPATWTPAKNAGVSITK